VSSTRRRASGSGCAPTPERVFLVGWDGLRPDLITPAITPNLSALIERGVRWRRPCAVFPSETRPNHATIGTGCQPGRHGITANAMHVAELGLRPLNTGRPDHLLAIGQRYGRVVPPPTFGEVLAASGQPVLVIGSGSPGQTLLQNPHGAGWTINKAIRVPPTLDAELEQRFGRQPAEPLAAVDTYLQIAALEYGLAELQPRAIVLWSGDPDVSLHRNGLGSAAVEAALRGNDARLGLLLERIDLERDVVLFISDHGHTSVIERIDVVGALVESGLARRGEVAVTKADCYLSGSARDRLPEIVAWLRDQRWVGPVFVRDDRWDPSLVGAAPASVLWDGEPGRWVPDVQFSYAWDDAPNARGVPGRTYGLAFEGSRPVVTDHGSLSPRDMGNVMVMAGAGVRRGVELDVPAGTVDVAPTILHLLGAPRPEGMQGRALAEALEGGDEPGVTEEPLSEGPWGRLLRRRVDGSAYLAVES
jgi:phosphonoacetate hydrolase